MNRHRERGPEITSFRLGIRIISGLADLVLIVEAREKSGSLITAQWALDQGKGSFCCAGTGQRGEKYGMS